MIAIILFFVYAVNAANCKKGIPCGDTCIAANKVCHAGGGSIRIVFDNTSPPKPPPVKLSFVTTTQAVQSYSVDHWCRIYYPTDSDFIVNVDNDTLDLTTQSGMDELWFQLHMCGMNDAMESWRGLMMHVDPLRWPAHMSGQPDINIAAKSLRESISYLKHKKD